MLTIYSLYIIVFPCEIKMVPLIVMVFSHFERIRYHYDSDTKSKMGYRWFSFIQNDQHRLPFSRLYYHCCCHRLVLKFIKKNILVQIVTL